MNPVLYGFFNENFNKEFRELFQKVRIISEKCLFHCLSCHKSRIIESTYLQEIVLFFLFFPIVNIVDSMSREKDFLNGCCWISFVPLCNRKYLKREGALWKVYIYALGGCVLRTDSSGGPKTSFTLFQSSIKTRIEIILNSWAKFQLLYTRTNWWKHCF